MKSIILAMAIAMSVSAQHYAPINSAVDAPSSPVNSAVGW